MIGRLRHRGLRQLYSEGDRQGLNAKHVEKIDRVLAHLDVATAPDNLNLPGFHLHPLQGDLAGASRFAPIGASFFDLRKTMLQTSISWITTKTGAIAW